MRILEKASKIYKGNIRIIADTIEPKDIRINRPWKEMWIESAIKPELQVGWRVFASKISSFWMANQCVMYMGDFVDEFTPSIYPKEAGLHLDDLKKEEEKQIFIVFTVMDLMKEMVLVDIPMKKVLLKAGRKPFKMLV